MLESYAYYVQHIIHIMKIINGGSCLWIYNFIRTTYNNMINRVTAGSCPHSKLHPQSPDREFSQTVTRIV